MRVERARNDCRECRSGDEKLQPAHDISLFLLRPDGAVPGSLSRHEQEEWAFCHPALAGLPSASDMRSIVHRGSDYLDCQRA